MNRGWCSGGGRRAWWALSGLALGGALVASAAAGGDPGRVTNTGVVGRPAHPSPLLTDTGVVGRPARPAPLPAAGASPARTRQFTDTFAPGWQIVVTQLAADRYHLYLEQSVLAAGGVGEARQAFARCGQHLARE